MRVGRLLPVLALVAVAACGGGGDAGSDSTGATSSPTTASSTSTAPTIPPATTTSPGPATSTTVAPTPPEWVLPASWLRYGADGIHLASADGEQLLIDEPIGWATSDGAGGVLFTTWNPDRFGPTWWLPGGARDPVLVSEWDDPLIAALVDGQPAAVGALPTEDCESNGAGHMVARLLSTGASHTLECGVGGPDSGREPDSFGGGVYVGVEWNAVHESGRSTAIRLVFRNDDGDVIDLPTNPYPDDCSPCVLMAALSPDGSRLAVVHRPDAPPYRPDERDEWLASTAAVEVDVQVFDLSTGEMLYSRSLPGSSFPGRGSWFDGRFVVLGPDAFAFPWLASGDHGEAVATLQELLVAQGATIEIDGAFGPATRAAVEGYHLDRFGATRSTVGADTWAELGVPTTIIDIETGTTTQLPGQIALEVILEGGPAPGVVPSSAELDELAILRADGIGPYTFGTEADEVQAWLAEQLGEPDTEIVEDGAGGWPLPSCAERRFSYWAAAGLTVGFTDLNSYDPTGTVADCDDTPHLAGWYVVDQGPPWFAPGHGEEKLSPIELQLTTRAGIGLGATAGELRAAEPSVEYGEWDIDEYAPAIFQTRGSSTPSECDCGMRGLVAWDHVADVQRALNERGAALAVDGTLGPRTEAALTDFQTSNDIDEYRIGPLTLDALGVAVPDDAPVVYLAAGRWDWWF